MNSYTLYPTTLVTKSFKDFLNLFRALLTEMNFLFDVKGFEWVILGAIEVGWACTENDSKLLIYRAPGKSCSVQLQKV